MSTALKVQDGASLLEKVVIGGDLAALSAGERMAYYSRVCESVGLNPLMRPFDYLDLHGKLVLYANRRCAAQLRVAKSVSISKPDITFAEGLVVVSVTATDGTGRCDSEIGAVAIEGLKGEARANAIMKAITKAKRRVTLSLCGLGLLDETELDSVPHAKRVDVDMDTGEVTGKPKPQKPLDEKAGLIAQIKARAHEIGKEAYFEIAGEGSLATRTIGALQALLNDLNNWTPEPEPATAEATEEYDPEGPTDPFEGFDLVSCEIPADPEGRVNLATALLSALTVISPAARNVWFSEHKLPMPAKAPAELSGATLLRLINIARDELKAQQKGEAAL